MDSDDAYEVTHAAVIVPLVVFLFIAWLVQLQCRQPGLSHIPSIGFLPFPFSYIGALRFPYNAGRVLQKGYQTGFPAFKIAHFTRWTVVITYPELIEELRKAPEDQLSSHDAGIEADQLILAGISTDSKHVALLSAQLARNLPLVFPELREEMLAAFSDVLRTDSVSEWSTVSAVDGMTEMISRVCNRGIVGPQTCREAEIIALNRTFIRQKTRLSGILPRPIFSTIARLHSSIPSRAKRIHKLLAPQMERRRQLSQLSKKAQHDILSLLISESSPSPHASRAITHTILALNFQAVPTTSLTFTHALYHLATCNADAVVQPMREEIEAVLRQEGWTLAAVEHMRRVDSFLKESMRISGLHALTMQRQSRTHYTFSDGTRLPAGTYLAAAALPTHLDVARYPSPFTFDATRFLRASGSSSNSSGLEGVAPRYQLATTSADFLAWGHGRAACPGRFFAAVVMKMMLAHMVQRYEVRLGPGGDADAKAGQRPRDVWVGLERLPDLDVEIQFRRRR